MIWLRLVLGSGKCRGNIGCDNSVVVAVTRDVYTRDYTVYNAWCASTNYSTHSIRRRRQSLGAATRQSTNSTAATTTSFRTVGEECIELLSRR